jgi:hypothetical protein
VSQTICDIGEACVVSVYGDELRKNVRESAEEYCLKNGIKDSHGGLIFDQIRGQYVTATSEKKK